MGSPSRTVLSLLLVVIASFSAGTLLNPRQPVLQAAMLWPGSRFEGPLTQNTATPVPFDACSHCRYAITQAALHATLSAQYSTPQLTPARPAGVHAAPIVHAVMFWMDGCPHCHEVLDQALPPLQRRYQDQLEILLIEVVTAEDLERLYQTAAAFGVARENVFVPFLVIGDRVLIGAEQIPAELPGLIETYLAQGGVDYPRLEALSAVLPTPAAESGAAPSGDPTQAVGAALPRPNGFALAMIVMAGTGIALIYTGISLGRGLRKKAAIPNPTRPGGWREAAMVTLCLAGLVVAGYLAYVEIQRAPAACGPVGDCNAVQSSPYARLFGILPVGVLGVIGYLAILAAWGVTRLRSGSLAGLASLAIFAMAAFGAIFSLYLTYLEPFVIKAVCPWCLASAVIMTLLMLLSLPLARQALMGRTNA